MEFAYEILKVVGAIGGILSISIIVYDRFLRDRPSIDLYPRLNDDELQIAVLSVINNSKRVIFIDKIETNNDDVSISRFKSRDDILGNSELMASITHIEPLSSCRLEIISTADDHTSDPVIITLKWHTKGWKILHILFPVKITTSLDEMNRLRRGA